MDGNGTKENPYLIKTWEDFNEGLRNLTTEDIDGRAWVIGNNIGGQQYEKIYVTLENDISAPSDDFSPDFKPFVKNYYLDFDGKGHRIKNISSCVFDTKDKDEEIYCIGGIFKNFLCGYVRNVKFEQVCFTGVDVNFCILCGIPSIYSRSHFNILAEENDKLFLTSISGKVSVSRGVEVSTFYFFDVGKSYMEDCYSNITFDGGGQSCNFLSLTYEMEKVVRCKTRNRITGMQNGRYEPCRFLRTFINCEFADEIYNNCGTIHIFCRGLSSHGNGNMSQCYSRLKIKGNITKEPNFYCLASGIYMSNCYVVEEELYNHLLDENKIKIIKDALNKLTNKSHLISIATAQSTSKMSELGYAIEKSS